ncbi:ABC transporter permease [Sphingobacterium sp. MYb382]|uniref:ABC transporter permease n=1 Tax=Sphingobacterium sp. MYb382 TaxID=2745278 RepID=UPI0030A35558
MIQNFIKTAFRNLWKTKGYSFLNIFGLAIGITAAALIFLWVEGELTRNDNFANKKDIYVVKSKQKYDEATYIFESTPGPFAPAIKAEIPGIKHAARLDWGSKILLSIGDNNIYQQGSYVDPSYVDILSMEFLEGDRTSALNNPDQIVLSESAAKRFFGNSPAVGKTLSINHTDNATVSGVVKDFPTNSSFRFDWLISFKKYEQQNNWLDNWGSNSVMTIVQLEPNTNLEEVNKTMMDFTERKTDGKVTFSQTFLYPMSRWNMYNVFDKDGNEIEGRIKNIRLFSIIAWALLLIACINFMNLSTARSEKRAKEVGLRKVVGANRQSLIAQFIGESLFYAFLSTLLAILFVHLLISPFNTLIGKTLVVDLFTPLHLLFVGGIVLICGLLAGSYPAFYLSAFNPLKTLKGAKQKTGSASLIRRGLVILQYTTSVVLIICTLIIYQQIQHVKNRESGMDRSQVLTTTLQGNMAAQPMPIKEQLKATGQVEHVSLSNMNLLNIGSNSSGFVWEGKPSNMDILIGILSADEELVPTMSLKMYDGRNFNTNMLSDSSAMMINEALAKLIQPDGKVAGQLMKWNSQQYTIVGVVKDFVYNDFYGAPSPMVIIPFQAEYGGIMNIKTKAGANLFEVLPEIEKIVKSNNPGYPFEYRFMDEIFNTKFQTEQLTQRLATVFAVLSIVISCLGLFGLASYSAEQRAKEISIRKVLGASIAKLIAMLNKEFVLLVILSCLLAFPIAWWLMNSWLDGYKYRIDIQWVIFAFAATLSLIIALLTISTQAFRAASANPTKKLRNE